KANSAMEIEVRVQVQVLDGGYCGSEFGLGSCNGR
ncbi:hypothetical protein A2U01_0092185, partial [Trifolium medium]|nr:hypothetical protein [Trifolium medium]